MIDLHAHTTASDGGLSPTALVAKAKREGLTALAITDHDTTTGVPEALAAGGSHRSQGGEGSEPTGSIEIIPGIEVSVAFNPGTFHMIGLFIDPDDPALLTELAKVIEGRNARNRTIAENLNRMGIPIRLTDVLEKAGGGTVGRPHFSRVMIEMGVVRDTSEAFQRYLAKGGPAYEGRYRTSAETAISLIHGAGGAAVLCHPHTLELSDGPEFRDFLGEVSGLGLDALESHYGEYRPRERERYSRMAADCGLLLSGGSDFHTESFGRGRRLSVGRSGIPVPAELLTPLRDRAESHRARS